MKNIKTIVVFIYEHPMLFIALLSILFWIYLKALQSCTSIN